MRTIDFIREVSHAAAGQWPFILAGLNIDVPDSARKHTACPACGGHDRFRFDDNGRGAHFCNACGAGDGLELVKKVNRCTATQAAQLVAGVLGMDCRETDPEAASQRKAQREAERREQQQAQQQRTEEEAIKRRAAFVQKYVALENQTVMGESPYLASKGLRRAFPVLPDGSLLLMLEDKHGGAVAAQVIKPDGTKRLLAGSAKKGAYHVVNTLPGGVETVIIAEGLATAISVHLMRPDALTVCAVDANNLLPVAQVMRDFHPDVQIIIAADNDIKPDEPNTGKNAAEKAAAAVSGYVALPQSEKKADWNDIHQQQGPEAATTAFNASLYQPQGKTMKPQLKAIEGGKKTDSDPLKPRVESRSDGVFWITPKVDKDSGEVINHENWLCSALEVLGVGTGENDDEYLIVSWISVATSRKTTRAIPLEDIGYREGWGVMKGGGLGVTTKTHLRAVLSDWLQTQAKGEQWSVTPRAGWHEGAYIMPDGEIIGVPDKPVLFRGGSAAARGYSLKGTVDGWRDSVARLAKGNPSMMLGIATALAAPLVGLVAADGFGIHLFERSSVGKTTTANVAISLYGDPEALRLTWYGTALGIANEAEAHNDGLLPLDEVGQGADPKSVATSAYTLFNGKGKLQSKAEGGNRALKYWRTVAISTGEADIETFLLSEGIKPNAGQLVRLLNVPMEKSREFHEFADGGTHAKAIKRAWLANHGAAGREWIKHLSGQKEAAVLAVQDASERWAALMPVNCGEQVPRVADRFAILEAALLMSTHITGWTEQECRDVIQYNFNLWVREFGLGNKENQRIIERAEEYLNTHGWSRFAPLPYDPRDFPIANLLGYRQPRDSDGQLVFYMLPGPFKKDMAKGFIKNVFAGVLADAGMLIKPKKGYQTKSPRLEHLNGSQQWTYAMVLLPLSDEPPEE